TPRGAQCRADGRGPRPAAVWVGDSGSVPLEPFLGPGALDDVLAVAPTELRVQSTVFVPEVFELSVELVDLVPDGRVQALREALVQLGPQLAQLFDFRVDHVQVGHASINAGHVRLFPRAEEIPRDDREAGEPGRGGDDREEAHP